MLPLDADDELLPGALELMVGQIERASGDVGFVYPHAQHMGNRSDFIRLPAYNLWLLMQENYCPRLLSSIAGYSQAPMSSTRRTSWSGTRTGTDFAAGRTGHPRSARGRSNLSLPTPGFQPRECGRLRTAHVSRRNQTSPSRALPEQRPHQGRLAPALSLVCLDDGERSWKPQDLSSLEPQTCADFEVLGATDLGVRARIVAGESENRGRWVQSALRTARGRWVCLLTPASAAMLESSSFVERLLYCFKAPGVASSIVFANVDDLRRPTFAQVDDAERSSANPVAGSFARSPESSSPASIYRRAVVLSELAINLQTIGAVQWRFAGSARRHCRWRARWEVAPSRPESHSIDMASTVATIPPTTWPGNGLPGNHPVFPSSRPARCAAGEHSPGWTPAETGPLCRHLGLAGQGRVISNDRNPPPGYALEFDLGVTRLHAAPGTRRLIQTASTYRRTDQQNHLGAHRNPLGYIEDQPLPLLEALELRRAAGSAKWFW